MQNDVMDLCHHSSPSLFWGSRGNKTIATASPQLEAILSNGDPPAAADGRYIDSRGLAARLFDC